MPRYFLHVQDGSDLVHDPEGQEFVDLASARHEAVEAARDLVAERLRAGQPLGLRRYIVIEDEAGQAVSTVAFQDVLPSE